MSRSGDPRAVREAITVAETPVAQVAVPDPDNADTHPRSETSEPGPGWHEAEIQRESWEEAVARVAELPSHEYDRARKIEATRLGVKLSTLDRAIAKARGDKGDGHAQGQTTILPEHEPWPEPVALDAILNDLARAIRRHVILSVEAADVIALWAAHTWVFETFDYTPRLSIRSPARQCGKSTLLGVLKQICRRPVSADSISAASTFRIVEDLTPLTLLLDETDTFLKENEELRGVVNSGFAHDGGVIRTVEINRDHKPRRFRTFAPMVLAGIGNLPATIEDRAVPVTLHRKASGETVTKLREPGARVRLHDIGRRLARWAADNAADLNHVPTIPEALGDREGDISVVLLAIAEAAGGKWPTRARDALLAVFERRQAEEGNAEIGALLLGDILAIFRETGSHRIASTELCKKLAELEERPWPEWRAGKPITPSQLATLLRPFLVKPGTHRMPGGTLAKGYQRDHFNDVWKRYLGDDAPASAAPHASGEVQPVTPSQAQNSAIFDHPTPVTGVAYPDGAVTAPGGVEMVKNCDSYPVAAENTPMRDNDEGTVL